MISFFVPGLPQSQGSSKGFVVTPKGGGKPRAVITSTNKNLKNWRRDVRHAVEELKPIVVEPQWGEHGVGVSLRFCFQRPQNHYNSKGELKPDAPRLKTSQPDLDKFCRAALDALTIAGLYTDDAQVTSLYAVKLWANNPGEVGVHFNVSSGEGV